MWIFTCPVFLLYCWVTYCTALTQWELAHFDAYSDNVTYTTSYKRKLDANVIQFVSKALPSYDTTEYDEITLSNRVRFKVFANPVAAAEEGCLKQGPIALAVNGVPFLRVYSSTGYNAVTAESVSLDLCKGHVNPSGTYHYHGVPWCDVMVDESAREPDQFVGVALDGYPIYGPYNATGGEITASQLNNCGGEEYVNDEYETSFRYRLTNDFPYTLGCLHGETVGSLTSQTCIKPYICGENPANYEEGDDLYEECGGPWPTSAGRRKKRGVY